MRAIGPRLRCWVVLALNLGCGVDVVSPAERESMINLAPPSRWGRPLSVAECENVHQDAVRFDNFRCRSLESLNDSDVALSVEVWNQGVLRPTLVMTFKTKEIDTRAIAALTGDSKSHRDDALSVPLLGHLLVASEAVRGQQLTGWWTSPFHRYLITAAQGVINRMRCRYTAIGPDGKHLWSIDELDRIAQGTAAPIGR